ncbi:MAG: hypothetical protein MJZ71_08445 [Bacteroidales bacterium]|nr:hypothetical protein [Bacteroidales bacterium]
MKKTTLLLIIALFSSISAFSQLENLKLNGYIQTDFACIGKQGVDWMGPAWSQETDGNSDYYFRYGVRRGLLRGTFVSGRGSGALEINFSEYNVIPLVAFLQYEIHPDLSFQAGLLNINFGHELMFPSSIFEMLERSMHTQRLFPKEHDLGFMFTYKVPYRDPMRKLHLSAGMMSGNGINKFVDHTMNFMAHLDYDFVIDSYSYGFGMSWYEGRTNNAGTSFYTVDDNHQWVAETVDANQKNLRRYINFEAQLSLFNDFGTSQFRTEWTFGHQPSRLNTFTSQGIGERDSYNAANPFSYDREFLGAYLYYIQDIGHTPFTFVGKYAYLDQNTKMGADDIANIADATMHNIGLGLMYKWDSHILIEVLYDKYLNETNSVVKELNDDVCHLRLQYKF